MDGSGLFLSITPMSPHAMPLRPPSPEQGVHGHDDAGGAEAALRPVAGRHPLLDRVQPPLGLADTLHRGDRQPCGNI